MAGYTDYLNLYFKNPRTDGADTFNIQTMMNDNWNKIDAFASMAGLPPAGNGFAFIRCKDEAGNPVDGCICQIGSEVAITNAMGMAKFAVPGGNYSAVVTAPIDYGAGVQTVSVSVANSKATNVDVQIYDKTGGLNETGFTTSIMCMFSSRVVSADAFLVGGGGSGGASYARTATGNALVEASGSGGGGGMVTTLIGIDHSGLLDVSIGAGGQAAEINDSSERYPIKNTKTGDDGGTTTLKVNGIVIGSAEGGKGGFSAASTKASSKNPLACSGASGGSGSGGIATAGAYLTPAVGESGSDGGSGGSVTLTGVTASGGAGQGSTTVPFNGSSSAIARSPAGGSVGVGGINVSYGAVGNGAGAANGRYTEDAGVDMSASSGSIPGAGGGACCATLYFGSSGTITYKLQSGAGANGEVRFRWEVAS